MIEIGTILDNTYKVLDNIGAGGGGEIYLAEHLRLEKKVVIKRIKDKARGVIEDRGEADILKKLRHPYLPQVYDHYTSDEHVYTVMEYIEGKNFQELLKEGRKFTSKDIIKWGTQLSEALVYLHKQDPPIIHRDIKPSNIMLTPQGNVCLIDFNISTDHEEDKGVIAFTDGYSPLEQYGLLRQEDSEVSYIQPAKQNSRYAKDDMDEQATEILLDDRDNSDEDDKTEILLDGRDDSDEDDDKTEFLMDTDIEKSVMTENKAVTGMSEHSKAFPSQFSRATTGRKMGEKKAKVDERSDIYSLGATLYHILTGKRPQKSTEKVTQLSEMDISVNEGLLYIIEKSMKEKPKHRFQTATQLHNAFLNIKKLDKEYKSYERYRDLCIGGVIVLACVSIACTVLGFRRMQTEKYEAYITYLEESRDLYLRGQMEEAEDLCENAISLLPDNLDAYLEMVNIYYAGQKYEEGLDVINGIDVQQMESNGETGRNLGLLFFLAGECYVGMEDFENAVASYQKAIHYQPEEGNYYTRCAIALARCGRTQDSQLFLESAVEKGISDAAVYLTQAEIMLSEKKYSEAEELVYEVLDMTDETDISYHAFLTGVQIYEEGASVIDNSLELKRSLLERAINELESSYTLSLSEQLANVYHEMAGNESDMAKANEYYEKALQYFEDIYDNGYNNSHVLQNMANINQMIGDYEAAEKALLDMINLYPEDYSGYMYLTLLYIEIQDQISFESRDYTAVMENYEKANSLYQIHVNNGGSIDMNLEMLGNRIEDIRQLTD